MSTTVCKDEKNWVYEEFKNLGIKCGRTINRFIKTMTTLSKKPRESISAASSDRAEAKAIYRLLKRKIFTEETIMDSHKKQTIKNIQESGETVILSVQDTSDLDYTNLKGTVGLGDHGGKAHSRGLILHKNIAITTDGIALGLLDQKAWARDPAERGKRKTRHERPIEEKESYKWLESMERSNRDIPSNIKIVNICDREGDIFEFFHKAIVDNRDFLVRVVHNRKLDKELRLFEKVHSEKALGTVVVEIPRDTRKNIKGRKATIEIKCVKVLLPEPPRAKVDKNISVEINLILANEIDAPDGIEPIKWYLATNIEIRSFDGAFEKVKWYVQRWKIERFHYVLKSGCEVEELQQEDAEGLKKLILMYSIIAIRILGITYLAREKPEMSCEVIFEEEEWKVLYRIANKTSSLPERAPNMKEAVDFIAKLGGFLGRKGDGEPGVKVIWRGLRELDTVLSFYSYLIPNN